MSGQRGRKLARVGGAQEHVESFSWMTSCQPSSDCRPHSSHDRRLEPLRGYKIADGHVQPSRSSQWEKLSVITRGYEVGGFCIGSLELRRVSRLRREAGSPVGMPLIIMIITPVLHALPLEPLW